MSNGIYSNLVSQLDKLYKHNRQGSIKSKERYYEAMKRFCRFLAEHYRLEKLTNIAPKHLCAYVEHMQENDLAPSTIETDLSAIRFWHDKMSEPRHKKLPDNKALGLEKRTYGKLDRTWSDEEFTKMVAIAQSKGRDDYVTALTLAYYAGMRVEECFTIDTAMTEQALRESEIAFHGKNGRFRTVPIDENIAKQLQIMLLKVKRGSKLLTPDDLTVGQAISRFQGFIIQHRDDVQALDRETPLTAHGLRHSYACRQYRHFAEKGYTIGQTFRKVSELLGHNRASITRLYLASVLKGGEEQ